MSIYTRSADIETLRERVRDFIDTEVIPLETNDLAHNTPKLDQVHRALKEKAKAAGIYLPQLPSELGGLGLSWQDAALIFEEAGRSLLGAPALNIAAPDEGNMHTLAHLCNPAQREKYLVPLAAGKMRSCFSMTEPAPGAGSDPSLLKTSAEKRGGKWVMNGRKWFITGAEDAGFSIVLAQTQSGPTMFLVDADNPGFKLVRNIGTMDAWSVGGHCEIDYVDCEVDESAVLGEPGKGFEYAQLRLGPARLTHCMRWLGVSVRATEIAQDYAAKRDSFSKKLADHQSVQNMIADSHIELSAARSMIQHAAWRLDENDRNIKHISSMTKVFVSEATSRAVDRAVQITGALGISEDTPISHFYRDIRPFRIYDGANEVHRMSIAQRVFRKRMRP